MWKQRECTEMCLCMNTPWSVHQERSNTVYQTHACLWLLYVTAIVFTLIAILNHQNSNIKRSWFALSSRENIVCISYSGGKLRSVCISHCATREWALALFRNNHRACVLKRNTLELIISWKRNVSIYSLCHLLCNQPGFLYISPVLD